MVILSPPIRAVLYGFLLNGYIQYLGLNVYSLSANQNAPFFFTAAIVFGHDSRKLKYYGQPFRKVRAPVIGKAEHTTANHAYIYVHYLLS